MPELNRYTVLEWIGIKESCYYWIYSVWWLNGKKKSEFGFMDNAETRTAWPVLVCRLAASKEQT